MYLQVFNLTPLVHLFFPPSLPSSVLLSPFLSPFLSFILFPLSLSLSLSPLYSPSSPTPHPLLTHSSHPLLSPSSLQFFLHIDVWSEACSSGLVPSSTGLCKESLAQHKALQERYQLMYNTTRTEGHRLIEKLKKPVGESRYVQYMICNVP